MSDSQPHDHRRDPRVMQLLDDRLDHLGLKPSTASFVKQRLNPLLTSRQVDEILINYELTHHGFLVAGFNTDSNRTIRINVFFFQTSGTDSIEAKDQKAFGIELNRSQTRDLLSQLNQGHLYKTSDPQICLKRSDDSFSFVHTDPLGNQDEISPRGDADTSLLIKWLSHHSGTERNASCPCGSGVKFKFCCLNSSAAKGTIGELPTEIEWLNDLVEDKENDFQATVKWDSWVSRFRHGTASLSDAGIVVLLVQDLLDGGHTRRAIGCLERLLETKLEDQAISQAIISRLATAHLLLEEFEEADKWLSQLPDSRSGRYAIMAQMFKMQGNEAEAISYMELQILEDPNTPQYYAYLLEILEQQPENPLYEYWLDQSVRMLPSSPWVAFYFARHRWQEARYEELAGVDWFDGLDLDLSSIGSYSKFGQSFRLENTPDYVAARSRFLRDLAACTLNPNLEIASGLLDTLSGFERQIVNQRPGPSELVRIEDERYQFCPEARGLYAIFFNLGSAEQILDLDQFFCTGCKQNGLVPKYPEIAFAMSAFSGGDIENAVKYCEQISKDHPEEIEHIPIYALSLGQTVSRLEGETSSEQIGLTERAVTLLTQYLEILDDDLTLTSPFHIAFAPAEKFDSLEQESKRPLEKSEIIYIVLESLANFSLNTGRLGAARYYYSRLADLDQQTTTMPYASQGYILLSILNRQFEKAIKLTSQLSTHILEGRSEPVRQSDINLIIPITETAQTKSSQMSSEERVPLDIPDDIYIDIAEWTLRRISERDNPTDNAIDEDEAKVMRDEMLLFHGVLLKKVVGQLIEHAKQIRQSSTYTKEVLEKNATFGSFKLGSDPRLKVEQFSIPTMFDQDSRGPTAEAHQSRFLQSLEQLGDFSVFAMSLTNEINQFDRLPETAKASLYEAERRFLSDVASVDHSPIVLSYAKAVEISLEKMVFGKYRKLVKLKQSYRSDLETSHANQDSPAVSLYRYLKNGNFLTLGTIGHLLSLCNNQYSKSDRFISLLRDFINSEFSSSELISRKNTKRINQISRDYRNPAAHSEVSAKSDAEICRRLCIETLNCITN